MVKTKIEPTETTKEKILHAAKIVFMEKGKAGARMDEIARAASVNKAMIYYYFQSKDVIYNDILRVFFMEGFNEVCKIINKSLSLSQTIQKLVEFYVDYYANNPDFGKIILRELIDGGINIKPILKELKGKTDFLRANFLIKTFEAEINAGNMRPVNAEHLILNIIAMCCHYFIARPLVHTMFNLSEENEKHFLSADFNLRFFGLRKGD